VVSFPLAFPINNLYAFPFPIHTTYSTHLTDLISLTWPF
jgi:hypothetical protein